MKNLITNHIRQLRFKHNEMIQQQLADLTGVTKQTIVAIEKQKYSPSLELAFLIARVFAFRWKTPSPSIPETAARNRDYYLRKRVNDHESCYLHKV